MFYWRPSCEQYIVYGPGYYYEAGMPGKKVGVANLSDIFAGIDALRVNMTYVKSM